MVKRLLKWAIVAAFLVAIGLLGVRYAMWFQMWWWTR
jgi:hypothetical protein